MGSQPLQPEGEFLIFPPGKINNLSPLWEDLPSPSRSLPKKTHENAQGMHGNKTFKPALPNRLSDKHK